MKSREGGFTLLEVLFSFVIAASVLVVSIQTFASAGRGIARVQEREAMARLARSRLYEMEAYFRNSGQKTHAGVWSGIYEWGSSVERIAGSASDHGLYRVRTAIARQRPSTGPITYELSMIIVVSEHDA
ncbi:MAG: prepilin-type N-terminal cleavage/methylation domain-containing protein [Pseudomonadota bacterium]